MWRLLKTIGLMPMCTFADEPEGGGGGSAPVETEAPPSADPEASEFPDQREVQNDGDFDGLDELPPMGDDLGPKDDEGYAQEPDDDEEEKTDEHPGAGPKAEGTEEAGEEPGETPADGEPSSGPGFTESLLAKAQAVGLNPARVAELADANQLSEILLEHIAQQGQAQPPAGVQAGQQGQQPMAALRAEDNFAIDPDVFDENFIKMEKVVKHNFGRMAQLEQIVGNMGGLVQQHQTQAAVSANQQLQTEFEQYIKDLGEDYEPIFGKGTASELGQDSPQLKNRQKFWGEMETIFLGHMQQPGARALPRKTVMTKALHSGFGEEMARSSKKTARTSIAKSLKKRAKGALNRPTQRRHQGEPSGESSAVSYVKSFLKEHGEEE